MFSGLISYHYIKVRDIATSSEKKGIDRSKILHQNILCTLRKIRPKLSEKFNMWTNFQRMSVYID